MSLKNELSLHYNPDHLDNSILSEPQGIPAGLCHTQGKEGIATLEQSSDPHQVQSKSINWTEAWPY